MKILVFGKTGQIAKELNKLTQAEFLSRQECDLTKPEDCAKRIINSTADVVINLAAYTNVDDAEENEELATAINSKAPEVLAKACAAKGIPLIHLSTDYVYGDEGTTALTPDAATNPINVYGRSKLLGDLAVEKSGADYVIFRTSWVFSQYENNFYTTINKLSKTNKILNIVNDQIGGPTPATELAKACLVIAKKIISNKSLSGIYHMSGFPDVSWAQFAKEFLLDSRSKVKINCVPSSKFQSKAKRQKNSRLNCDNLSDKFGINRPSWKLAISELNKETKI